MYYFNFLTTIISHKSSRTEAFAKIELNAQEDGQNYQEISFVLISKVKDHLHL
jgi:hypothetical protein